MPSAGCEKLPRTPLPLFCRSGSFANPFGNNSTITTRLKNTYIIKPLPILNSKLSDSAMEQHRVVHQRAWTQADILKLVLFLNFCF